MCRWVPVSYTHLNGVKPGYPTLIWWAKDGTLNACLCAAPQTYKYVRRDLGAD